ncbi:RNA methyltransferase [Deinococcus sonorensis]|uniref:RNA methyltransferase n=2 Tax=Deinococcus sonorensis TaxID=309891 RepID=A0AAU7U8E4_9DEIO
MLQTETITSVHNPQLKRLVRLHHRRDREREGVWLIEGAREVQRALDGGLSLQMLYLCPELYSDEGRALVPRMPSPQTLVARPAFERVSHRENPDGVLAVCLTPQPSLPPVGPDALVLVLVGLEKPGNLGALLRTADGVGVDAVLLTGSGTDLGNPNVIRSSQGSVFTQPVAALEAQAALTWLREHHFVLVACTPEAEQPYWSAPLTGRVALLLGSEHDGLPPEWREAADLRVSIPMRGQADSLNVATAGALVLYESLRQRQGRGG